MSGSRRATLLGALLIAGCGRAAVAPRAPAVNPASTAPRITTAPLDARPVLGDLPAKAMKLGAGPLAIVTAEPMVEGERIGAFVDVPKDVCLLTYARSSMSLEDVDLAAFTDEGNPVAVDEGPDPKPTLLICPPHPDRVYVAVHAAAGEGLCVVGAQLVPRDRADIVGRGVDAHGSTPKTPEAWPGLDDQVRAHRRSIGGTWEEQRRVAVAVDARVPSIAALTVDEGACVDAVVVPDEDVVAIDVDFFDADGRLVARAKDTTAVRTLTLCSPMAVAGSLRIRPHVGRGVVAVVLSKAKGDSSREMFGRPDVAWVATAQPLDAARSAREKALVMSGYGPAVTTHNGQLQLGRRVTVPVDLGSGCNRIDVVAGAPLSLVDASAWDASGGLLGSGDGADGAVLFVCGTGRARVDLGTRGRPGPFSVVARPEKWKSPLFSAHPLAASRMLGRATGTGGKATKAGAVYQANIEPAKRYVHDANIAAGQCLQIAVGGEGEGTGLEVRLFDAVSGEELDRSHGQVSASVRACAGPTAASVRVEARATAGKLDAIFGETTEGT